MKIRALVTTRENHDVDVNSRAFLHELQLAAKKSWGVSSDAYITAEGRWEEWEDTGHGSGLTTKLREATEEEREVMRNVEFLIKFVTRNNLQ